MISEGTLLDRTLENMKQLDRKRYIRKSTTVLIHQIGELYFVCDEKHDPTGREGYIVSKRVFERDYEEL